MSYDTPQSVESFMTFQPYEMWERARSECPVIRYDGSSWDARETFHVTQFTDAEAVLGTGRRSRARSTPRSSASTWATSSSR